MKSPRVAKAAIDNPDRLPAVESLWRIGGLVVLCLFAVGALNPGDLLWGVNHLAFLAPWQAVALLALAAALLLIPAASAWASRAFDFLFSAAARSRPGRIAAGVFVFVIAAGVFYFLRIKTDLYGDTLWIVRTAGTVTYPLSEVVSISKTEPLSGFLYRAVRTAFDTDLRTAYQVMNIVVGGITMVAVWRFVVSLKTTNSVKLAILVLLVSSGFNQVFFGHVENYALVTAAAVFYLMVGWRFFDHGKGLWLMALLVLVGSRLHAEMVLFLPGLLYAVAASLVSRGVLSGAWIRSRVAMIGTVVILLGASALYFLYFHAARAESAELTVMVKKVFLPLVTEVPELNGYTLFSGFHLHDVAQVLLLVSSPLVILAIVLGIIRRRDVGWGAPRMVFLALSAAFCVSFTFMVNPVLTMTRDWDLLAISGVPLAFLATAVILECAAASGEARSRQTFVPLAVALGMLSATIFVVNGFEATVGGRLRSLGVHSYKSTYRSSAELIHLGTSMIKDPDEQILELEQIISRLEPHRLEQDMEFSILEQKLAEKYYRKGDLAKAELCLIQAMLADTTLSGPLMQRGLLLLKLGYNDAGAALLDLFNQQYNDPFVQHEGALLGTEAANYLRFLEANGADEGQLQAVRDMIDMVPRQ